MGPLPTPRVPLGMLLFSLLLLLHVCSQGLVPGAQCSLHVYIEAAAWPLSTPPRETHDFHDSYLREGRSAVCGELQYRGALKSYLPCLPNAFDAARILTTYLRRPYMEHARWVLQYALGPPQRRASRGALRQGRAASWRSRSEEQVAFAVVLLRISHSSRGLSQDTAADSSPLCSRRWCGCCCCCDCCCRCCYGYHWSYCCTNALRGLSQEHSVLRISA